MTNSIAYNNLSNAVLFAPTIGQVFNYNIKNSLLKYDDKAGFVEPKFANYYIHKMNLRVKEGSGAIGKGMRLFAGEKDITGAERKNPSTIGAYEF